MPKTIHVCEGGEIARLLDEVDRAPVLLERADVVYRLTREGEDLWASYSPDEVRAGMAAAAGTLTPEDGEKLKGYIYQARGGISAYRPAVRRKEMMYGDG